MKNCPFNLFCQNLFDKKRIHFKQIYTYIFEIGKKAKKRYFHVMFAHSSSDFIVSLSIIFVTIINVAEFSTALRKISVERWFDNQYDCIFLISCFYLRSIQYPNFLHSKDFKSQVLCYKIAILFICYDNGNTRLNCEN